MIVFFIGLVIGAWLGVAVMACCARSGDAARCEECEYKNNYMEKYWEAHRKYVESAAGISSVARIGKQAQGEKR